MSKSFYQLNRETGKFEKKHEAPIEPEKRRVRYVGLKKYKSKYNPEGK